MKRWSIRMGAGAAVVVAGLAVFASPAPAEVTGPCQGTIKGVDVAPLSSTDPSQAIKVAKDDVIQVGATSTAPIATYKVQLGFAGVYWTVGKGTADGTSWSRSVNVKDYARYGVGLYQVRGVSSGAAACSGAALVKVGGNPLSTPAGMIGLALSVIGVGAVGTSFTKCFRGGPPPAREVIGMIDAKTPIGTAFSPCRGVRDYLEVTRIVCRIHPVEQAVVAAHASPQIQRICLWG
ncbi:MAG TPA: hypothetical protein VF230_03570 [Acidimicrobiales bacterium]